MELELSYSPWFRERMQETLWVLHERELDRYNQITGRPYQEASDPLHHLARMQLANHIAQMEDGTLDWLDFLAALTRRRLGGRAR